MSQQIQIDICHTKMLQNALWCQITLSKLLCNILEYCSHTGYKLTEGYCNSFYFYLLLYNYWEYVIECVFAIEGHWKYGWH